RELRGRDEHGRGRVELLADVEQRLQRGLDDLALAEALLADLARGEHRELEALRGLAAPAPDRPHPGERVVRLLDLDEQELLEVPRRGDGEACTANRELRRRSGHRPRTIARISACAP